MVALKEMGVGVCRGLGGGTGPLLSSNLKTEMKCKTSIISGTWLRIPFKKVWTWTKVLTNKLFQGLSFGIYIMSMAMFKHRRDGC